MRLTDEQLKLEIEDQKLIVRRNIECKVPNEVIKRSKIQLELLEELSLWRENGRRWLAIMKQ